VIRVRLAGRRSGKLLATYGTVRPHGHLLSPGEGRQKWVWLGG